MDQRDMWWHLAAMRRPVGMKSEIPWYISVLKRSLFRSWMDFEDGDWWCCCSNMACCMACGLAAAWCNLAHNAYMVSGSIRWKLKYGILWFGICPMKVAQSEEFSKSLHLKRRFQELVIIFEKSLCLLKNLWLSPPTIAKMTLNALWEWWYPRCQFQVWFCEFPKALQYT